ncbi:MAG: hypothetical protein WC414_01415 [Patescibacteria group bacterium]
MNKKKYMILIIIIVTFLIGSAIFFYFDNNEQEENIEKNKEQNKEQIENENKEESDDVLKKISKLFDAPEEVPIISRISDINQPALKQAFFAGAENGDYLLIYKEAGKAVLYSAKKNKILNMGPFSTEE